MTGEFGEAASRRELVALFTGLGLAALGGCRAEDGDSGGEVIGTTSEALKGTSTGRFADTTAELRATTGGAVGWCAFLLGNAARGDGGGGAFYWDSVSEADDGGTRLNAGGLGSVSAGWRRVGGKGAVVNVRDFGANGTGGNETAAIQAAVAALPATGGTLLFPPGTYGVDAALGISITGRSHLRIVGAGATLQRQGSGSNRVMTISTCTGVSVSGLRVDLNGVASYGGLAIDSCQGVTVEGCRFFDSAFAASGVDHYAATAQLSTEVWFVRNWVERSKVEFNENSRVQVAENVFLLSEGSQAIALVAVNALNQTFSDYLIARNVVVDAEGDAIGVGVESTASGLKTFRRIAIVDNLIAWSTRAGEGGIVVGCPSTAPDIRLDSLTIRGNVVHYAAGLTPTRPAVELVVQRIGQAFHGANLSDNQVVGFVHSSLYAMSLQFLVRCSIRNNRIAPVLSGTESRFGIQILDAGQTEIIGNTVTSQAGVGTAFRLAASGGSNGFEGNRVVGGPSVAYDLTPVGGDSVQTVTWRRSVRQSLPAVLVHAQQWEEQAISLSGAVAGDTVVAHPDGSPGQAVVWSAYVYLPNEIRVRFVNPTSAPVTTLSRNWRICLERWA
jgi:hypothetical protein